ncbi:flagellar protein FliT [Oxalobacteraceae bacterium OM1]|nr:flagellar protein FliT [Oxalobacteraceae bacterium OM1]
MSHAAVLLKYQDMLRLSQSMLDSARHGDWEALITHQSARGAIEAALVAIDQLTWPPGVAEQKRTLIEQVLAADAETRERVQAWMSEIDGSRRSAQTEKKLQGAYLSGS